MLVMPGAGRLQVPLPAFFLQHPGEPPVPFSTWISAFDAYLHLVGLERGKALTASTKNSLLFSLLGQEGLRQFGNNPVVATMTEDATTHAIFWAAVRKKTRRSSLLDHHRALVLQSISSRERKGPVSHRVAKERRPKVHLPKTQE